MDNLTFKVKEFARQMGADLVGIANIERWDCAPPMLSPKAHLDTARSVVVMGIHHPDASVEWGGLPSSNYAGPFQIGMIPKLDTMARHMAMFLENFGAKSIPYPCTGFWRHRPYKEITSTNTASFSHRHAAVAAGLGEFGVNNLFLSKKFGPRQRLISVITDLKLTPDPLYDGEKLCDKCGMCKQKCPGNNYDSQYLLDNGVDVVQIENKKYEYAKLNRWRCLWGEQFAFDMDKLKEYNIREEKDLFHANNKGVPRKGGEFGNCLRYCMAKPVRYWQRNYTSAPRRKKEKKNLTSDFLIEKIIEISKKNGADKVDIRPLKKVNDENLQLHNGYPLKEMRENFDWLISIRRKLPAYPIGHEAINDNEAYLKASLKVRLSIASYEIAAFLDNMGYEAMQDWMSAAEEIFADEYKTETVNRNKYLFEENERRPLPLKERYKVNHMQKTGVQREQQSMTAGAQNEKQENGPEELFVSCAVICQAPLEEKAVNISRNENLKTQLKDLDCLKQIKHVAVTPIENFSDVDNDIMDFNKILPGARSVITLLMDIPTHITTTAGLQKAECATSYSYLQYQTLRELIWTADDLCKVLEKADEKALPIIDASLTSIRTLAPYWEFSWSKLGHPDPRANAPVGEIAGLGEIGRSGHLLVPEVGASHKMIFIVTSAIIEKTESLIQGKKLCLNCGNCAKHCPVGALIEKQEDFIHNKKLCEWARSLGMSGKSGSELIGWKISNESIPEKITEEAVINAFNAKDPLQTQGYLYPCQIDTIVEACIQKCPAR
jgi:epoxyqueuosine reductase QueG